MPVMNGWDATKEIVKLMKENKIRPVVIIALTAYDDANSLKKCTEVGMEYILQKPLNNEKLQNIIEKL